MDCIHLPARSRSGPCIRISHGLVMHDRGDRGLSMDCISSFLCPPPLPARASSSPRVMKQSSFSHARRRREEGYPPMDCIQKFSLPSTPASQIQKQLMSKGSVMVQSCKRRQVSTYGLHPGALCAFNTCQPDPGAAHEIKQPHGDAHE